jgi:hypothetical protein
MLVVVRSLADPLTDEVIAFAEKECGLRLISRGIRYEPGIQEANE